MHKDILCIILPHHDIAKFNDPDGDIIVHNSSCGISVKACNLISVIEETKLEDYSFWLGCMETTDTVGMLEYLNDNNIKYCSFNDERNKLITNPDLISLERQLYREEHRIWFTKDINFVVYDGTKVLMNSILEDKSIRVFVSNYIDEDLISIFESTGTYVRDSEYNKNIDIYDSDIPLFIRWLRRKYTTRAKSANKICQ